MKSIDDWSEDATLNALCYWTILSDVVALAVAAITLYTVFHGPRFVKNGLLLIIAAVSTDIVLEV